MNLDRAVSFDDFRSLAKRRLPRVLFDYIDGGSYGEVTIRRNAADLDAVILPQRVMRDMTDVCLETRLLGQPLAMPVVLGPVGFAGMFARRGEVQAARAARSAGIPFTLSTVGICSAAEVVAGAGLAPWFQLYMVKDRGLMAALLQRIAALGSPVLMLTVDLPTPGARYRDLRSGMGRPRGIGGKLAQAVDGLAHPGWLRDVQLGGKPHSFGNLAAGLGGKAGFADAWSWIKENFDPSVTWAELDFVRKHWPGPVVVKGVLDPADARSALAAGADALVISNHGGRQLDGALSSIRALPAIVDAVGDQIEVHMDSGIRSGQDVLKALAMGAKGTYIGRAFVHGLGAMGEAGVTKALEVIRKELDTSMALCGERNVSALGRHNLLVPKDFAGDWA